MSFLEGFKFVLKSVDDSGEGVAEEADVVTILSACRILFLKQLHF